jgi:hypothetical protein
MSNSVSSPFFLASAEDLLRRLDPLPMAEARELATEARELITMFRGWAAQRPTDDARVAGIARLFELNRRAMDMMAKHGPPSSGGRTAR